MTSVQQQQPNKKIANEQLFDGAAEGKWL